MLCYFAEGNARARIVDTWFASECFARCASRERDKEKKKEIADRCSQLTLILIHVYRVARKKKIHLRIDVRISRAPRFCYFEVAVEIEALKFHASRLEKLRILKCKFLEQSNCVSRQIMLPRFSTRNIAALFAEYALYQTPFTFTRTRTGAYGVEIEAWNCLSRSRSLVRGTKRKRRR